MGPKPEDSVSLIDFFHEKTALENPQIFQSCKYKSNNSAIDATTMTAASGGNREELLGQWPARHERRLRREMDAGSHNSSQSERVGHFNGQLLHNDALAGHFSRDGQADIGQHGGCDVGQTAALTQLHIAAANG